MYSLLITDIDPADLADFWDGASPGMTLGPSPQTCPTCGRAYDLFDHDTSVLLDWIARLDQDLHHLKRAVEEVLP